MNSVKPITNNPTKKVSTLFMHVSSKEQVLFARNVSLLVKSGVPILNALQLIQKQTTSGSMKKILTSVISDVENGMFLSTSLMPFEKIFGPVFINIVNVGEASGMLAENMEFLADELKKQQGIKGKIIGALIYPLIIVITTVGLSILLIFFVFPKILPIFSSFKMQLPLTTRILIGVSNFMINDWLWIIIALILMVIAWTTAMRVRAVKFGWELLELRIPIIGNMIKSVQVASLARTIGLLMKSGINIIDTLAIVSGSTTNLIFRQALEQASDEVKAGRQVGKFLETKPRLFPPMFSQMIEIGETTGTLNTTLFYLSDYYQSEVDETTENLVAVLEPLMMIVMGLGVGFIAVSILLPIYSMTQILGK